jgi:hypothetical protein
VLDGAGLTRFGHDLFRGRDGFLLFALGDVSAAFARFIDHFLRLGVGFGQDLRMPLLRFRELLLDLLRVQQPLGDALPALFEHGQDRLVGKLTQDQRDNDEADDLREKNPDIESEGFPGFADHVSKAGLS